MNFSGVIIEESLADKSVLGLVKITSTEIESATEAHKTPWIKQWTMHAVEIPGNQAAEIAEKISKALDREHNWYADYKNDRDHYIIYRDRVFHITDRSDRKQYEEAAQYGVSIGIPAYQVDFSPHIKHWQRNNMPKTILKSAIAWGLILWLIGYALGFVFFAIVPPQYIGWAIMPIATLITIWVLVKKINGTAWKDYLMVSAIWTLVAIIFDYLFIVLLLKSDNYYKLDVYLYYILTFILPPIVGALKSKPQTPPEAK